MKRKGRYYLLDAPIVAFGYTDETFEDLVNTYIDHFENGPPPGEGTSPARALAIADALEDNKELTLETIESYSHENNRYRRDEPSKSWAFGRAAAP